MDGDDIVNAFGESHDPDYWDWKTVTGAAVVVCAAGATVHVVGCDSYNSVYASGEPRTTFSGFII